MRVLDLFAGAGGLSEGLRTASGRYVTTRAIEFEQAAAATYEANHGSGTVYAGPIQSWLDEEDTPTVDLVVGGPPCQGFSALGKQDINDERNRLWSFYAETIERARPRYFVLENVPAFLTSPQFARFAEMCAPGGALQDYAFDATVMNAAEFGAPQIRKRVIVIGHHRDFPAPGFPAPPIEYADRSGWKSVREALRGIPLKTSAVDLPHRPMLFRGQTLHGCFRTDELHLGRRYEPLSLRRFAAIGPGGNRFDLPPELQAPCWRRHKSGSGDVMGRLHWDRPSVTIRTEFFKPEKGRYLHPVEHRALSHLEAARLQGFPDDYQWVGSKTSIARQIGNAVPVSLGSAIGRHLLPRFL